MHWITVFLAALLATGLGVGSALAQADPASSMEELLGGSVVDADSADFPDAVEGGSLEDVQMEEAPAAPEDASMGAIAADGVAVDGGEVDLEFGAEEGLVDLTPEQSSEPLTSLAPAEGPNLGPVGYDEAGEQGRIHVVVGGDTLWDISESYLGTPWVWPSIWESNPGVANPHRIFPGDQIWITPSKMKRVTPGEAAQLLARSPIVDEPFEEFPPAAVEEIIDAIPTTPGYQTLEFTGMHSVAYVSEEQYVGSGSIVDSPSPHRLLSETRRAYLNLGGAEVSVGDRFSIVRASEEVRDPSSNRKIGFLVERLGWLEVTRTRDESSEALIKQSFAEIERGDRILPQEKLSQEIPVRSGGTEVEGLVAHFQNSRTVMAQRDVVFLNRGTQDGVEVGVPLEIYRDQGSARDSLQRRSVRLPEDVVAGLVVISAEPATSVAVVTYSKTQIERGDNFRTVR
jgi:hypothetical protein